MLTGIDMNEAVEWAVTGLFMLFVVWSVVRAIRGEVHLPERDDRQGV